MAVVLTSVHTFLQKEKVVKSSIWPKIQDISKASIHHLVVAPHKTSLPGLLANKHPGLFCRFAMSALRGLLVTTRGFLL